MVVNKYTTSFIVCLFLFLQLIVSYKAVASVYSGGLEHPPDNLYWSS